MLCKAWNISQQPLCLHGPLAGWLRPVVIWEHTARVAKMSRSHQCTHIIISWPKHCSKVTHTRTWSNHSSLLQPEWVNLDSRRSDSYPWAGCDNERLHAGASVVTLLFAEAWVNDIDDAINGQRGLCDIGSHHHLAETGRECTGPRHKVRTHCWAQREDWIQSLVHLNIKAWLSSLRPHLVVLQRPLLVNSSMDIQSG